jgi:hypothetical protein
MISEEDLVFLSFLEEKYSRSGVLLSGMPNSNFRMLPKPGFRLIEELIRIRINKIWEKKVLVVMSPAHILAPFLRIIFGNSVVLDAGWPLLDGALSRLNGRIKKFNLKLIKHYFLDLLAFHSSHALALESDQQVIRTAKLFGLKRSKLFRSFTGFDEVGTSNGHKFLKCPILNFCPSCDNTKSTLIFFRGKFNREAGLEILAQATKKLEKKDFFFVIATNSNLEGFKFSRNTLILNEYLNISQIAHLYESSRISIGQLSDNPRLQYTIPHKAFEAAYFKTPYLTRDSLGIRELFKSESDAIFYDPSKIELCSLIDSIANNNSISEIACHAFKEYSTVASQKIISQSQRLFTDLSDNGIEIDLDIHEHKFFGMYKTFHGNKDAREIGLFITKNQVEAMRGKIEVQIKVDVGTTFKVFLSNKRDFFSNKNNKIVNEKN